MHGMLRVLLVGIPSLTLPALGQLVTTYYPSARTGTNVSTQFGPSTLATIGNITTDDGANTAFITCSLAGNGFESSAVARVFPFATTAQVVIQQCTAPRGLDGPSTASHGDQLGVRCVGAFGESMTSDELERCGGLPVANPGVLISGSLPRIVLREGGTVGGLPVGVTFGPGFPLNFWSGWNRHSLIVAPLQGPGVAADNDLALLRSDPLMTSGYSLLAREGSSLSGVNLTIANLGGGAATALDLAFWARIAAPQATPANDTALFRNSGTNPVCELWVREDSPVIAPGPAVRLGEIPPQPRFASRFASFVTTLRGASVTTANDFALVCSRPGSSIVVAREGDAAPGIPGAFFATFTGVAISRGAQRVAFAATLSGPGVTDLNDESLWIGSANGGPPVLQAREGDPATGTPADVVFDSFAAPDWDQLFLRDTGDIVFRARLRGPGISEANDVGLWQTLLGQQGLIIREGSPFSPNPEQPKTVGTLRYSEISSADDGEPRMSASFQSRVAFGMIFTDGEHGLAFAQSEPLCVTFTGTPYDQVIRPGRAVYISVGTRGVGPITYQWKKDGEPLADDGRFSGTTTASLSLAAFESGDAGVYTCVATNSCRSIESGEYNLSPFCAADFNADGGVDGGDVDAFFTSWEAGFPEADINDDGGVDGGDVEYFFLRWQAGGC